MLDPTEADDDILGCRLDVLGLRKMEPDLAGRLEEGGIATRVVVPFLVMPEGWTILSAVLLFWPPSMLPFPVGEGNWVNLNSVEADSRLLCRSSKLTEGRKS